MQKRLVLMVKGLRYHTIKIKNFRLVCAVFSIVIATSSICANEFDKPYLRTDVKTATELNAEMDRFLAAIRTAEDQAIARLKKSGAVNLKRERGFSSHPVRFRDILPFKWEGISDTIPIMLFSADRSASRGLTRKSLPILLEAFNIKLVTANELIDWPPHADLNIALSGSVLKQERTMQVKMRWDSDISAYFLADPYATHEDLMRIVDELTPQQGNYIKKSELPTLKLISLTGFEDLIYEIERIHFPRGIAVTHSVRLGSVRLSTDFSWLGRPAELLALFPPRFIR